MKIRFANSKTRLTSLVLCLFLLTAPAVNSSEILWHKESNGLWTTRFDLSDSNNDEDSVLFVVKIDPDLWEIKSYSITELGMEKGISAREWADKKGLVAVINAGMYDKDLKTHIGMYVKNNHSNNSIFHSKYKSAAVFNPKSNNQPPFRIIDLDETNINKIKKEYDTIIQNERLIKRPGENRWKAGSKKWWSEAALAEDKDGNVLFLYTPASFNMYDFNKKLLSLPLNIECAQHLDGGFPAQIFFNYGKTKIEFHSGMEVFHGAEDTPGPGLPLPNIIGISAK